MYIKFCYLILFNYLIRKVQEDNIKKVLCFDVYKVNKIKYINYIYYLIFILI